MGSPELRWNDSTSYICEFLSASELFRLYLTGDRYIWKWLSMVSRVEWCDTSQRCWRWPKVVEFLPALRSFKFHANPFQSRFIDIIAPDLHLDRLPPGIEHLELVHPNAWVAFSHLVTGPSQIARPNWSEWFPDLQHLVISATHGHSTHEIACNMPSKLTSLSLSVQLPVSCIPFLPPNLTLLSAEFNKALDHDCVAKLPQSLTSLSHIQAPLSSIFSLPPHLTELTLTSSTVTETTENDSSAQIAILQNSIMVALKLHLSNVDSTDATHSLAAGVLMTKNGPLFDIARLFPNLAILLVYCNSRTSPVTFPASLTNLTLVRVSAGASAASDDLVELDHISGLRELWCHGVPINWNRIPKSLAHMTHNLRPLDVQFLQQNSTLRTLAVPHLILSAMESLPTSLTKLYLSEMDELNGDWIPQLPSTLLFLSGPFRGVAHEHLETLPKQLHTLEISGNQLGELSIPLPATMRSLALGASPLLTDSAIASLPPLTSLSILSAHLLTNLCASLLPRGLTQLDLPNSPKLTTSAFSEFPRGLMELNLYHRLHVQYWAYLKKYPTAKPLINED